MPRLTFHDLGVWYPGAFLARKFPWIIGRVGFPLLVVVVPLLTPLLLDLVRSGSLKPSLKVAVLIAIGVSAAAVAYLKEAESRLEKLEKEDAIAAVHQARQDVWRRIGELNSDAAGATGQLVEALDDRSRNQPKFQSQVEHLQTAILANIADCLSQHLGLDRRVISANWSVLQVQEGKEYFVPLRYDRHDVRRAHGSRSHELASDKPGASRALLTGKVTLVPDTQSSDMLPFFPDSPAYRSILSIPVTVRNSRLGVVNIDATEPNLLSLDLETLVADLAYLIGLCEHLKGE
ncbi:MAG: GAF domain-containing protein [Phycisphaeraceae bacterium]|nr:GAF domain-containing protein [Phycisphaeraceae bacterium]